MLQGPSPFRVSSPGVDPESPVGDRAANPHPPLRASFLGRSVDFWDAPEAEIPLEGAGNRRKALPAPGPVLGDPAASFPPLGFPLF